MEQRKQNDFTHSNVIDCERSINELQAKKNGLTSKKVILQTELSELNSKARGNILPKKEYESLCRRQILIKRDLAAIEVDVRDLNNKIRERSTLKDEIKNSIKNEGSLTIKESIMVLRDKYMQFASDTTRVSSMRAMASKFSEELELILKSIE